VERTQAQCVQADRAAIARLTRVSPAPATWEQLRNGSLGAALDGRQRASSDLQGSRLGLESIVGTEGKITALCSYSTHLL